ncbi:hypothetical protein P3X46_019298 [Hevea brasiliensis]|uniref:BZIP domain-containing protein n=1 Tax=Hevea brasiliensis TaxID=3981 RepID=A0ABQ9LI95_HEVBR|nr:uncharacterized protein LOC110643228 isoform X2 [Hevea brasiliensis]KAJ9167684.1 hypothetical protein P3X46_019298 [Hevea brasiliensis]
MVKDEWIRAAMTDDRVVVELLLRLKQAHAAAPARPQAVIPIRWGLRLPRSKPATAASVRCDVVCKRKEGDSSARCSPTTPLSWSGGGGAASPSATVDGFEETSPHVTRSPPGARSKGTATAETASTSTKRSRRKKTFAELKEEESFLLKERMHLKKEITTLNSTFEEQVARNENLKRIKFDLKLQYANNSSLASDVLEKEICNRPYKGEPSSPNHISSMLPKHVQCDDDIKLDSCETQEAVSNHDRSFLLPDLNMMPSEDPHSETLPGMR